MLRIGDAERDAAAADLGEHFVAGRLSLDELHERLGDVFSAKTQGQLSRVMADLPGPRRTAWADGNPARMTATQRAGRATPSDRAGRIAALSLLILAMLIWLFTALLFARHGFYHEPGPFGPVGPH
jgi:Flp pilus assembly protein TadB